jgi:glycosyltransferase involved in cell wall biosynthesis
VTAPIVLNALALRPGGSGVQTYIRELLRELPGAVGRPVRAVVQEDAVGELPAGVDAVARPRADGVRRAVDGFRPVGPSCLIHGLNTALPLAPGVPKVVTVHDLAYFDAPWAGGRVHAAAARAQVRLALRRADAIIAVSAFTAERVRAWFGREATPTPLAVRRDLVVPDAPAIERVRTAYALPERFVLHVGTIEPRKDVPTLADACARVGVPLILVGEDQQHVPLAGTTRRLGHVPAADLAPLYGAATVTAYTSRYEGFGLPPLEALACGAALVATSIPPLRETLGDAAVLVPPARPEILSEALSELLADDDRRAWLAEAGRRRAASFSWTATAQATAAVYRSLL